MNWLSQIKSLRHLGNMEGGREGGRETDEASLGDDSPRDAEAQRKGKAQLRYQHGPGNHDSHGVVKVLQDVVVGCVAEGEVPVEDKREGGQVEGN